MVPLNPPCRFFIGDSKSSNGGYDNICQRPKCKAEGKTWVDHMGYTGWKDKYKK